MGRTIIIGAVLALTTFTGGAWASDGCVEISQVNVATAGTISAPGCYVLTSDLSQGLTVTSVDGVTIDLNGFTVAPGPGTPAVSLSCPVDSVEIRNGTLDTGATYAVLCSCNSADMSNHEYRDLRIQSEGVGIQYNIGAGALENLQLENVVIHTGGSGVFIQGTDPDVLLRNLRFHRLEIRSESDALSIVGTPVGITQVYGFQLESSALTSTAGVAAVWLGLGGSEDNELEGSIRQCELVAPDDSGFGVVSLDVGMGALHCFDNNLLTPNTGVQATHAFWTPFAIVRAPIVVRGNTSSVGPIPSIGTVISPPIGHDGTNPVLSNYESYLGTY